MVQPHRYTRLQSLFDAFARCFNDADTRHRRRRLSAGESRRSRASTRTRWRPRSTPTAIATRIALPSPAKLAGIVRGIAKPGDYVVCLGAGNITQWAYALPGELEALEAASVLRGARQPRASRRGDACSTQGRALAVARARPTPAFDAVRGGRSGPEAAFAGAPRYENPGVARAASATE